MTDYPNWFTYVQPNFEQFLLPLAGKDRLMFLQLGAFTGDASVWMRENVLTGVSCQLTDVDTWQGSDEEAHIGMDFTDVYSTYLKKIEPYNNILHLKQTSREFLINTKYPFNYDFIYIDADHTTIGVILDAELSWSLLKPRGMMAFDDYLWSHESGDSRLAPRTGIDLFLHRHEGEYELLIKNHQVWIRKK